MYGYICHYSKVQGDQGRCEVYVDAERAQRGGLLAAQEQAREIFQKRFPRRKVKGYEIRVGLAEKNGEPVVHVAVD